MTQKLDARYPCPVCLGVNLRKAHIGGLADELVLDHCERCGGVWFELGEVQLLRRSKPKALWSRIAQRTELHRMSCHQCHTLMGRHESKCAACGWDNRLNCPMCETPMAQAEHEDIRLDVCRNCKGVWFDHDELASIWNQSFGRALERNRHGRLEEAGEGTYSLMHALAYDPFLMFYGVHAAGHALGAGAQALSHAPEAVGGAIEAAGEVAGGVFETIVEIISGLFG